DQFRDQAALDQVLGLNVLQQVADGVAAGGGDFRAEADSAAPRAVPDGLFEPIEGPASDERDVGRVALPAGRVRWLAGARRPPAGPIIRMLLLPSSTSSLVARCFSRL